MSDRIYSEIPMEFSLVRCRKFDFFHRGIVFNFLRVSNGVRVGDLGSCRCLSMEVFAFGDSWVRSFKRFQADIAFALELEEIK